MSLRLDTFYKFLLLFFISFISSNCYAQFTAVAETNGQVLAQKLTGPGVVISNVQFTGGNSGSSGTFINRGNNLKIDSGIVLTTGKAIRINGQQTTNASSNNGNPGDFQLDQIATGTTKDATVLEFDVTPFGDTIRFKYVFGSEEYPEYNCTNFNDIFAFFLSGPGIVGIPNIAYVPGTKIPVSINSINSGVPGSTGNISTCNSLGPGSPFTQYYVSNAGSVQISYDGLTTVLVARAVVIPCQTYHLKIAIADVQDGSFDSGVFLEANSLSSSAFSIDSQTPIDTVEGLKYIVEGCTSGAVKFKRIIFNGEPVVIDLSYGGTAQNGVDVQQLPSMITIPAFDSFYVLPVQPKVDNLPEGTEQLRIYASFGSCGSNQPSDSFLVEIRDFRKLGVLPANASVCRNGSVQLTASPGYDIYLWNPDPTLSNPAIPNPVVSPPNDHTYYVRASKADCHARDTVPVVIKKITVLETDPVKCFNGTTGRIKVSGGLIWQAPVEYAIDAGSFGADSNFLNLTPGVHIVKIKDATGCIDSLSVNLPQSFPTLVLDHVASNASCLGTNSTVNLTASGGLAPYVYSNDGSNYSVGNIYSANGTTQNFYVRDANLCVTVKTITIPRDPDITFSATTTLASCSGEPDGSMTIVNVSGGDGGPYTFSAPTAVSQNGNVFIATGGDHNVTVSDQKGCSITKVITIPKNNSVQVTASADDTVICQGLTTRLHAQSNATTVAWSPLSSVDDANSFNPVARPARTQKYIVTASRGICTGQDSITITVRIAPVADAGVDKRTCYRTPVQLSGAGGIIYNWQPSLFLDNTSSKDPFAAPASNMIYTLKVTDAFGCESLQRDSVRVTVIPEVKIFAGNDTLVATNQPVQLFASDKNGSGIISYSWSPANYLNNSAIANPVARSDREITLTVRGNTIDGCSGTDDIKIKVYKGPEIYVPTAFTPNNDRLNDELKAIPVGLKEFHYFKIYNRWGKEVFKTSSATKGWNGNIDGHTQLGVFIWVAEGIDYTGQLVHRTGLVTILR